MSIDYVSTPNDLPSLCCVECRSNTSALAVFVLETAGGEEWTPICESCLRKALRYFDNRRDAAASTKEAGL